MILENGVIRTMDESLPTARALAIAGERVAGGVGTHETALASPDVVNLGGRCVLPAFTDSHVHFPTWSLAQDDVRLHASPQRRGGPCHVGALEVAGVGRKTVVALQRRSAGAAQRLAERRRR